MSERAEPDLVAVRELRAGAAEPTDLAVARTRHRVLATLDQSTVDLPRTSSTVERPGRGRLAVAGAAAAVVLLVGLVVAIQTGRGRPAEPAAPSPSTPSTTDSVRPAPTGPLPDLAVTPVQLPPGAVLLVRSMAADSWREVWLDPEGCIVLRVASSGPGGVPAGEDSDHVAADRESFARLGPSLVRPTPSYLAALPTDPDIMLAMMADELARSGLGERRDEVIFTTGSNLLLLIEPLLSTEQRAALLAALALAPGVTADHTPRRFAGHDVYTLQRAANFNVSGVIVDSASGRVIGSYFGMDGFTEANSIRVSYAVVAAPGERP